MKPQPSLWAIDDSYFQQMKAGLEGLVVSGVTAEQIIAIEAQSRELDVRNAGGVVSIPIKGPLFKADDWITAFFDGTSYLAITAAVNQAVADADVKTIVLVIDSPGGVIDGVAETADAIFAARQQKRVIAQVDGTAASAAYWLAAQAGAIYAQRMDVVGSIGVRLMLYDYSAAFEAEGVKAIPIDTGPHKSAGAVGTEITEEQQAEFQRVVDVFMDDFKASVVRGRDKMSAADVNAVADGRVFVAGPKKDQNSALTLKLIDGIASVEGTLAAAVKRGSSKRRATRSLQLAGE